MNKKTIFRSLTAALLVFAMLFAFMPLAFAAEEEGFVLTELPDNSWSLEPIPLLIIKVSYDANKNGKNDFDSSNGRKLYGDKSSEYYGEQWCYSSDKYWYDAFFSKDKGSMRTYYEEVSGGSFYFYPAEETYESAENQGVANDGIVEVVIPYKHPMATTGGPDKEDATSRNAALKAAGQYVDFSKFDKNGDGYLSYTELAIVYICGGYEASANSSRPSDKLAFGVHGHQTGNTAQNINGVYVGASFVRVGEYYSSEDPLAIGTIAHELGHFIGAPDLYDNGSGVKWNYVGDVSLMASGSWSNYPGTIRGTSPAYLDPYNAISCGLVNATEVFSDGEYILYSRNSSAGAYNILKINTPDPNEYYLVENRYHASGSTEFDALENSGNNAIIIWHIDEKFASQRTGVNASSSGHDPGVVPMGISAIGPTNCGFRYIATSQDGRSYTFEANSKTYKFPVSGTSFTSLTGDDAKNFNLKIVVGDVAKDEMKVTITGVPKIAPMYTVTPSETTTTSITIGGRITDLCGGDVREIRLILSKNANATEKDGIVKTVYPNADGTYSATFDGLESNTKYFCKVAVSGKNGERERIATAFTKIEKTARTDYYEIFLYKGLTAVEKRNRVKVKPGETFQYTFPMEKRGYAFCGWYLDPEYKERYDMGFTQTVCEDFTLYAKWVETGMAASLKLVGAESKYKLFACEIGDSFDAPVPAEKAGYKFVGWYSDEELTLHYDFGQTVDEAGEITIYAKWESDGSHKPETTTTSPAATTTPATTTVRSTTAAGGEGGCGSAMGAGAAVALIGAVGLALLTGRKKER